MGAGVPKTWNVSDIILDLYRVTELLGEGGFGKVYKVRHTGWNIDLAVKIPKPEIVAAKGGADSFEREAQTWVNLGLHPHTVSCYYVRRVDGAPAVFAEYVAGGSLRDWIDTGKLYAGGAAESLNRILDIAIQLAWGLDYAHEQGLIHQDVKPANAMLTPEGALKITDFGLSATGTLETQQLGEPDTTLIVPGSGAMTPAYCSPEQANGFPLTRRTDLWSWALSILEMFQGERTWPVGTIGAHALENYLDGEKNPQLPQMPVPVAQLLQRCFQENPDDRPRTLREVADELRDSYRHLTGETHPRPHPGAGRATADSLNNRAVSLLDLGRHSEALELWDRALSAHPRHPESTYNRGLLLWRSGQITDETLIAELEEVRQSHPQHPTAGSLAGFAHLERDDCAAAIEILSPIQDSPTEQPEVQAALALARELIPDPLREGGHAFPPLRSAARLQGTPAGDRKKVNCISVAPDRQIALCGKHDGTLELWDTERGEIARSWEGHEREGVKSICIIPEGRFAASASDLTLKVWDLATGQELCCFALNPPPAKVLSSPDGRFALRPGAATLTLEEVPASRKLLVLQTGGGSLCLSRDGRYVLAAGCPPQLRELATGEPVRTFEGHAREVSAVCLSADGRLALSGSADSTVKLWDVGTGACLRTFVGHRSGVTCVCLSPDGQYALSGSSDRTVRLWEVATGRCRRTFAAGAPVSAVCTSPDGSLALSGGHSGLKLWQIRAGNSYEAPAVLCRVRPAETVLTASQIYEGELAQARAARERGDRAAAAGHVRLARAQPGFSRAKEALSAWAELYACLPRKAFSGGWEGAVLAGHRGAVTAVCASANSRLALSASADSTLKLWDLEAGECLRAFEGHRSGVTCASLSPDGRYALSGSEEGALKLWEVATGRCLQTFAGEGIGTVATSPDYWALTGSADGYLRLYEAVSGRCLRTFRGHRFGVSCVCISPDGRFALSGEGGAQSLGKGFDKKLKLWDVATGRCLRIFAGHGESVTSVCLSGDGRLALSGSADRTMKLWEVKTGICLQTFAGHGEAVTSVCLSADGRFALSGSEDKTVKLWEVGTGICLQTFAGHTAAVRCACFSADGRWALSGSNDGSLRLWVLDWELEDRQPVDWDDGALPYLEAFLTLRTPYAGKLPEVIAPQSQLDRQQGDRLIRGFLVRLFAVSWAGTALLAVSPGLAGVAAFLAGAVFGVRTGWAGAKVAALLGVWAVAAVVLAIVYLLPPDEISGSVGQHALAGVLVAWPVYLAVVGVALGACSRQAFLGIASATVGNRAGKTGARGGNAVPGAAVWQGLKTKFGAAAAVGILVETVALGISLGMALKLGLLHRFVIWAVLATGVPLAWMIAGKSGASAGWKGLVKVAVGAVAALAVLGRFNWAVLSAIGAIPYEVCRESDGARNYLQRGGNPNSRSSNDMSLLRCAFASKDIELAQLLIAAGANVNERVSKRIVLGGDGEIVGETLLHLAVINRDLEAIELLISKGADINAKFEVARPSCYHCKNEITALHWAVQHRDRPIVAVLVAKGADVRARDSNGQTPLDMAEKNGYTEIAKLLWRGAKSEGSCVKMRDRNYTLITGDYIIQQECE